MRIVFCLYFLIPISFPSFAAMETLPGTQPLTPEGDLAVEMVAGIDRYLLREIEASVARRAERWNRDVSSHTNYIKSVEPNRNRLRTILGEVDARETIAMSISAPIDHARNLSEKELRPGRVGEGLGYKIFAVRWNVFDGVEGEGLLLEPDRPPIANVIALSDCDRIPEMLCGLIPGLAGEAQFARRLAENGCRVLVPYLINRRDTYSGRADIRMTNQPHREFLYRAAYEMGRHIIGYEIQKILAGVDWFETQDRELPIGVFGYGGGGLLAFYAGAIDPRIDAVGVSGYFRPREELWREPIYRNVWSLLTEFGDAEIASLIAPRALVVEACAFPEVEGPPATPNRSGAAPGVITTPDFADVEHEFQRTIKLIDLLSPSPFFQLIDNRKGLEGGDAALLAFLHGLGIKIPMLAPGVPPIHRRTMIDRERMKRQFDQLLEHTQVLMRESEFTRNEFWSKADDSSAEAWEKSCEWYKEYFWDEIIGRLPPATLPANARTRLLCDEENYKGYEVMLDVYPDVFAYGILLIPKNTVDGEKRPVVVCQHGLEGRPQDVADPRIDNKAYNQYACKLAELGFITYAPQNPYIGQDRFRVLLRKAQPLKLTLYSFIVRQHEQTLRWLASLPCVDAERIAFYGLSYGGKTAMRIPALLNGYCLSICSADYNEWIWKNVSARHRYSYLFTGEYDMPEFNLGNTFNYAEMSWMILPRPFMVERGHHDGVAPDEWVAYEFARTRRRYNLLGLGERAEIEFFNGPHSIHGVGTFAFLRKHLNTNY
ncbi:MAG: hypothetical protein C4527_11505 [Candidatus Omnitrophota bacterium]|jgi:dienelactone hydrolase|nr:MAG: hypothetical protein C4527_11505 [Candidatus Omnitrophota bacterium]